jgi:hypothetical protein
MKSPIRYLVENSTKSLCQPQDIDNFCFLALPHFRSFCEIGSRRILFGRESMTFRELAEKSNTHIQQMAAIC